VGAETPIETTQGIKRIDEVQAGDYVRSACKGGWTRVKRGGFAKGAELLYTVSLEDGTSFRCTGAHQLLHADGQWRTFNASIKEISGRQVTLQEDCTALLSAGYAAANGLNEGICDHEAQCSRGTSARIARGGAPKAAVPAVRRHQAGRQEPHARKERAAPPQLEGNIAGWEGVLHDAEAPLVDGGCEEGVRASGSDGEVSGPDFFAEERACAPYRREPCEQQDREPDGLLCESASRIASATVSGIDEVWDIETESGNYLIHDTIHHNSSSLPNLQQVPQRTETGKLIRTLFIPEPGEQWAKMDYSQIEPRLLLTYANRRLASQILAAFEQDPALSVYKEMGKRMPSVEYNQLKAIYLGATYGMGKAKMAEQMGVTIDEAEPKFREFHDNAPYIRRLSNQCTAKAESRGWIRTIGGRMARFPDPRWSYKALNRLIQGGAADILKTAMVTGYEEGLRLPMLTVHDELDMSYGEREEAEAWQRVMVEVFADELRVPMRVDLETGPNWGEVKG